MPFISSTFNYISFLRVIYIAIISIFTVLIPGCASKQIHSVKEKAINGSLSKPENKQSKKLGCTITIQPGDSFNRVFSQMVSGDLLCLANGKYSQIMRVPSNIMVRSLFDGKAEIDGSNLDAGWGALLIVDGSNSSVRGLKIHHASQFADTCNVKGRNNTLKSVSCSHGGHHKHKIPLKVTGEGHLIEDSWFYGEGRYVIQCFRGRDITFRRNVARWDSTVSGQKSEPNATFAIYNCSNITVENNISLDYGTPETPMKYGGDFYSPQHRKPWPEGNQNNWWLGNIVVNHSHNSLNNKALRLDPDIESKNNFVTDFYVKGADYGIVGNSRTSTLKIGTCTMINVKEAGFNNGRHPINCNGPADITHRYESRIKTGLPLFPWKNENLIKEDMCATGERQSLWCRSNLSLTDYILNPVD